MGSSYLEKIKEENANKLLLAATNLENTKVSAPLASPHGQVEEPLSAVDCCVNFVKKNQTESRGKIVKMYL